MTPKRTLKRDTLKALEELACQIWDRAVPVGVVAIKGAKSTYRTEDHIYMNREQFAKLFGHLLHRAANAQSQAGGKRRKRG